MRVMLLANPQAGLRTTGCPPERFLPRLQAWGWDVTLQPTLPGSRLAEQAYRAAEEGFDAVLAAGGDGTLHQVANGLAGTRTALGILPCGTANDLARSLELPLDPDLALEALRHAPARPIDLGVINGHYFLNVAALGVSAEACAQVTAAQKQRMGHWAYAWNALKMLLERRRVHVRLITSRGTETLDVYQLSIANGRTFGGGWRISEEAAITDRLLDIVAVEPRGPLDLLRRVSRPRGGMAERLGTHVYRLPDCRIEVDGPVHVNLDGEPFTVLPPLEFRVEPEALRVLLPERA